MFEMIPAQDLMASRHTATETTSDDASASTDIAMETDTAREAPVETAVVMMEWHSCNICLEEMVDSELLTHAQCGGTLCSSCLEASKAHQEFIEQKKLTCPVSISIRYLNIAALPIFILCNQMQSQIVCSLSTVS